MAKGSSFKFYLLLSSFLFIGLIDCYEFPADGIQTQRAFPPYQQHFYGSPFDVWRRNLPELTQDTDSIHTDSSLFGDDFTGIGPELRSEEPLTTNPFGQPPSDIPNNSDNGGLFFQQQFPSFFGGNPFLTTFGGFGFGNRREPWWNGPNVCTDQDEVEETPEKGGESGKDEESDDDLDGNPSEQLFSGFQFSVKSCVEKHNKHVCKRINNEGNKKKTLTVTKQCCHGFGRPRNADVTMPCAKIDVKTFVETAEEIGAKEFMRSAKNNGLEEKLNENITIFMPTDGAFTDFSEQMFENNLVLMPMKRSRRAVADPSGMTTKDLIMNHMVNGWVDMDDMENEDLLETNYDNATIRINIFPKPPNNRDVEHPFRYTANCAPLLKVNKMTTNGYVHIIDRVLTPATRTVMDIIRSRSDMAVLRTILEKTNMHELLEGKKPVTIFAPTDAAFEKLDMHMRRVLKEGKGCATNILKSHILDMTFCGVAVVADSKTTAYNLLGEPMIFARANASQGSSSEAADLVGVQDILINERTKILENDVMGSNGVLHVIDTIMPTETALPITTLLKAKNVTIFRKLIESADLVDEFDDLSNTTFFAPTDKAFAGNHWKKQLQENPESLKGNQELKEFLQYHIVAPMTKTCDLTESLVPTIAGKELRVNLYSTHSLFSNVMNRATVNCARLMHFDDESCGSVLHQVDKVLTPPKMTLMQQLESNPNYGKFAELIKSANLTDLLNDNGQSYTVMVPKNDVFEEVEDWEKNLAQNPKDLENLVKTHIVNDVICCAGIIPTNWPFVRTIESINNNRLRIGRDRRPKVENAGITKCDVIATNGILHEINDVIVARKRTDPNRKDYNFDGLLL